MIEYALDFERSRTDAWRDDGCVTRAPQQSASDVCIGVWLHLKPALRRHLGDNQGLHFLPPIHPRVAGLLGVITVGELSIQHPPREIRRCPEQGRHLSCTDRQSLWVRHYSSQHPQILEDGTPRASATSFTAYKDNVLSPVSYL